MAELTLFEDLRPRLLYPDVGSCDDDDDAWITASIDHMLWDRPRFPEKIYGLEFDCPVCRRAAIDRHYLQPDFFGDKPPEALAKVMETVHRIRIFQIPAHPHQPYWNLSGHTLHRLTVMPQIVIPEHHMRFEIADGSVIW